MTDKQFLLNLKTAQGIMIATMLAEDTTSKRFDYASSQFAILSQTIRETEHRIDRKEMLYNLCALSYYPPAYARA